MNWKNYVEDEGRKIDKMANWKIKYPYLSRDCGSRIHQMIENGEVNFLGLCSEEEANKWCEGFYTIDFQKNVFVSQYGAKIVTCKLNKLPSEERYLKAFQDKNEINL